MFQSLSININWYFLTSAIIILILTNRPLQTPLSYSIRNNFENIQFETDIVLFFRDCNLSPLLELWDGFFFQWVWFCTFVFQ